MEQLTKVRNLILKFFTGVSKKSACKHVELAEDKALEKKVPATNL